MSENKRAGRKPQIDPINVAKWRRENSASKAETARRFGISERAVAKACAAEREARIRWRAEQEQHQDEARDYAEKLLEANWANLNAAVERADRVREQGRWDLGAMLDVLDAANRLIPPDHRDKWWR